MQHGADSFRTGGGGDRVGLTRAARLGVQVARHRLAVAVVIGAILAPAIAARQHSVWGSSGSIGSEHSTQIGRPAVVTVGASSISRITCHACGHRRGVGESSSRRPAPSLSSGLERPGRCPRTRDKVPGHGDRGRGSRADREG